MASKLMGITLGVFAALAGCSEPGSGNRLEPTTEPPSQLDYPAVDLGTNTSTGSGEASEEPDLLPLDFNLDDCQGWTASLDIPTSWVPPLNYPEGWQENQGVTSRATMHLYHCQRIGWGEFERGPVSLLIDYLGPEYIPQACREWQDWNLPGLVHGFWMDDPEIATRLANLTGLPAAKGEIEVAIEAGTPSTAHVTWSVSGESSFLEFQSIGPDPNDIRRTYRLIWPDGERLFFLDWSRNDAAHEGSFIARGTVEPPLLFSAMPVGNIVATSSWLLPTPIEGRFSVFEDSQCAKPIT